MNDVVQEESQPLLSAKWLKGLILAAGVSFVGSIGGLVWALAGGGLDKYVDDRASIIVKAAELTVDGTTTQNAKLNQLTLAITTLTGEVRAQKDAEKEFRDNVNSQLRNINGAFLSLGGQRSGGN